MIVLKICVYGASSQSIEPKYIEPVRELGREIARRGHSLVFGGGGTGLMGAVANGVHDEQGEILGIVPKFFVEEGVETLCDFCTKRIEPETMRERKQLMEESADAFVAVPGGIGTFEELFEILTLKQLCRHNKPIALYNIFGYYEELDAMLAKAVEKGFVRPYCRDLYHLTNNIPDLFTYLESPQTTHPISELKNG